MSHRPVEQAGAGDLAVGAARAPFVGLKPECGSSPVNGRATDSLTDPCRHLRIQITGADPRIKPGQLCGHCGWVVVNVAERQARARLEAHDLDALLREFVAERAAAGAGPHDHHYGGVIEGKAFGCAHLPTGLSVGSQEISSKPRLR